MKDAGGLALRRLDGSPFSIYQEIFLEHEKYYCIYEMHLQSWIFGTSVVSNRLISAGLRF